MQKKTNEYERYDVKVSVVVPIYNSEQYLAHTMRSILNQKLREIEIICVDDGSEDTSVQMIEKFMATDSRIKLVKEVHQNAGVARQRGLLEATGEYVIFWDADDWFHEKALWHLYKKSKKMDADICICEACQFDEKNRVFEVNQYLKRNLIPEKDPFCKEDKKDLFFSISSNAVWNKMFRRAFIEENKIEFQNIAQANDTAFTMLAMFLAKRITVVKKRLVYYRIDSANGITSNSDKTTFCPYDAFMYTLSKLKEQDDFELYQKSFRNRAFKGMLRVLDTQKSFEAYQQFFVFLKQEGIKNLEIDYLKEEEFNAPWMYEDFCCIKEKSAEDFLIYKSIVRKQERDRLKYAMGRIRRRFGVFISISKKLRKIRTNILGRR